MSTSALFIVLGLLVFVAVGGITYAAYVFINPTRTAQDRLRELSSTDSVDGLGLVEVNDPGMEALAQRLGQLAGAETEEEKNRLRDMLLQAGYKHRHAVDIFNGIRVTGALCLPLFAIPFVTNASLLTVLMAVLAAAATGYYLPAILLTNSVEKRKAELLRSFPDCLDLLVSSVEAGLGIDAAFRRVAAEMKDTAPELAREFQLVNHEVSAGVPRIDALRHLHARTGLDEIRSLVNMLSQAERFGTSIAKSLRVHARTARNKRMSMAEEEAAKVSPKLTVIMILFLLPVLMSVLIGPAAINVYNLMFSG